jgi:hypothetical protein
MAGVAKDKGDAFERRVARLLASEGYFVRRRVNLERHFGERLAITDADLLVFDIGLTLDVRVGVGECKATEARGAPTAVDRLLWLTGVRRLLSADSAFLATVKEAPERIRGLAAELEIEVFDERDIIRREEVVSRRAEPGPVAHGDDDLAVEQAVFTAVRKDDELRRLYWFVRTDVWLQSPSAGLKRAMTAMKTIGSRWSDQLPADEQMALRWIARELIVGFALAIVRIAGDAYRHPEDVFSARLRERLSEGIADYAAMRKLAGAVDAFVLGILREAGVPPRRGINALGAFEPQPPAYFEPVAELIQRCAQVPRAASRLPHAVDGLVHGRAASMVPPLTGQLVRTAYAFLARQSGLPPALLVELTIESQGASAVPDALAGRDGPPASSGSEAPSSADVAGLADSGDPTLFGNKGL